MTDNCPFCGVSLIGEPVEPAYRRAFAGTHYRREIALYDLHKDRTVAYRCPDCGHEWPAEYANKRATE